MSIDRDPTRVHALLSASESAGSSDFFLELVDSVGALTEGVVDQILVGENEYAESPMPRELLHGA